MPTEHFLTNTSRKRPAGFIPPILNQSGVPIKGKVFPEKDMTINGRVSEIEMILPLSGASRRVLKLFSPSRPSHSERCCSFPFSGNTFSCISCTHYHTGYEIRDVHPLNFPRGAMHVSSAPQPNFDLNLYPSRHPI